jgi:hypothetical protein
MAVLTPVSIGELVDKITIQKIKILNIKDSKKLQNINAEYSSLNLVLDQFQPISPELEILMAKLLKTNSELWKIEDDIRECERHKDFGPNFVDLARSVYIKNDVRAEIKKHINILMRSEILEEKSYHSY